MTLTIGQLIEQGRKRAGLSRADLAALVGKSETAVLYWETGKKIPSGDTLMEIIKLLGLVEDFFPESFKNVQKNQPRKTKSNIEERVKFIEATLFSR